MIFRFATLLLASAVILSAAVAAAQGPTGSDRMAGHVRSTAEAHQLAGELSLARRSNDIERARQLQATLWKAIPTSPIDGEISVLPEDACTMPRTSHDLHWGDDVLVYAGKVSPDDQHPIAMVADTLGTVYVAVNAVFRDTLTQIKVYRSTDGGLSWAFLNGFYPSSARPIHSFDMCIADTAGGKFELGLAFVVQFSRFTDRGGTLYWCSMLSDGTGMRFSIIAGADSGHMYGNPSICTDGDRFTPALTYHYIATEYSSWNDVWHGLYITHSTNWGKSWVYPDTSIEGNLVENPELIVDHTTLPESLCVAYHHQGTTMHHISVARNSIARTDTWGTTDFVFEKTMNHPRMAIDPVRGNAILAFGYSSNPIEYVYSGDLFKTYERDTITANAHTEEISVSWSPSGDGFMWRVAYCIYYEGTVYVKAIRNAMSGFAAESPLAVNQYTATDATRVVVGQNRDMATGTYRTNCIYVRDEDQSVYFDAGDVTVDVPETREVPQGIALMQNWPNPFNPVTSIGYSVGEPGSRQQAIGNRVVKLAVYDLLGREVAMLVDEQKQPGEYTATWDASGMPSGVYFYRLDTGGARETKKMLLLR